MSRQSMAPSGNLTLTQELEKLEQSITLTLQEIDQNFSRAHRIVTANILPVVENYGKHSEAVWDGSKFWKQFFEASANVSLSAGYEGPEESTTHEETQESQLYDEEEAEDTVTGATTTPPRPSSAHDQDYEDSSILDSPSLAHAHSTPRAPQTSIKEDPYFADYSSPYEKLKHNINAGKGTPGMGPTTPGRTHYLPDMSMDSSPLKPPPSSSRHTAQKNPVLHHMLDRTYRIAATPHTAQKNKNVGGITPGSVRMRPSALDEWDLDLSPPDSPAPQLRADIFSPVKAPRTPGVSVQTPAKGKYTFNATQSKLQFDNDKTQIAFDTDSEDDDDDMGFSPPKTMQFHIPQSRLLQTPAREASKRIVEDLLLTAGGNITDDTGNMTEDSPSIVRRKYDLDDSF